MRLLAVVAEPPWPAHSGYRIRCWELLSRLAGRFPTRLICLDRGEPRSGMGEWTRRFESVRILRARRQGPGSLLRSLVSPVPHHARLHDGPELRRVLAEEAARSDVIVAHYLYFARALLALPEPRPPLLLDQHNLDRDTWESHAGASRGPLRAWLLRQSRLVREDERRFLPAFRAIFSVSAHDAARTEVLAGPGTRIVVAPNGADCARVRPVARDRPGRTIVFTGTRARRNVDGLAWFLRHVWPIVRREVPQARLVVAGRIASGDLPGGLGREAGVTFTGPLPDLQPALDAADIAIVPIRLGGGTKLKAFEGLASGVPVVALSAPATGTCCHEDDGLLAESHPASYAAAISRLLRDDTLRRRLGAAGRRHAEQEHDWALVAERVGDVLADIGDGARAPSPAALG